MGIQLDFSWEFSANQEAANQKCPHGDYPRDPFQVLRRSEPVPHRIAQEV